MTSDSNSRFNAEAAAWDSNPDVHRASDSALEAILASFPHLQLAKAEGKTPDVDVLEIGCGTGLLSFRMAPYVQSLLAVDAADGMINALNLKLQAEDAPRNVQALSIMLEDPEDPSMPAANGNGAGGQRKKFDLVLSHLVLHHIPDLHGVLSTMFGCLKSGGSIALTDFEDFGPEARRFHPEAKMAGVERHGIPRKEFASLIESVGFEDVHVDVAWKMNKEVERYPNEWAQGKKPTNGNVDTMDFPFILAVGRKP